MPLTDRFIKSLKRGDKTEKHFDGDGLFIEVRATGGPYWRLTYRFGGKEKLLALGVYPDVSLKEARAKRDDAKKQIATGIDPSDVKKAHKASFMEGGDNSFENIAREWFARNENGWAETHSSKIIARLENDVFPYIGAKPIELLNAPARPSSSRHRQGRSSLLPLRRQRPA